MTVANMASAGKKEEQNSRYALFILSVLVPSQLAPQSGISSQAYSTVDAIKAANDITPEPTRENTFNSCNVSGEKQKAA